MKIGYIRVSRDTQTTALQEDALHQERCELVFTDKMSGQRFDRPEFLKMLERARAGDVIVVWRLDRLGRSLKQLIETVTHVGGTGNRTQKSQGAYRHHDPDRQTHVSYYRSHGRV